MSHKIGRIKIKPSGFGIASYLPREEQNVTNPHVIEGRLAYISPEQTGRMNRGLDYRTDFYSIGINFYEILTGQLPFQATDPLELVHSHMAKTPTPPSTMNPAIPGVLSRMVMKLLAKTAEEAGKMSISLASKLLMDSG